MFNTPPPISTQRHVAFTLVELLVVVAVLAILVAIALPSILSGLERAKQTSGLSGLRQIGVGFMSYAAENSNKLPHCFDQVTGQTYAHFVQHYLPQDLTKATHNIFVSPAAGIPIAPGNYTIAITYSAHPRLCHEKTLDDDRRIPLNSIGRPSQVIVLADGPQIPWNNNQATASFWNPWQVFFPEFVTDLHELIPTGPDTDTDDAQGWFRYRNKGAVNALMADGHVRSFKKGTVTFANLIWDR